jgi:alanyl-tRNA synthetase
VTERIYYQDTTCVAFHAHVVETYPSGDRLAVVLERTAFYPAGGGQPCDTGTIAGYPVLEVFERETDQAVVHLLPPESVLPPGEVESRIDWARRFDHMQQHTGQHILSQAFAQLYDADTVGFHMSQTYSTIDLNRPLVAPPPEDRGLSNPGDCHSPLGEDEVARGESLANQVVFEDRPVDWSFVTAEEARRLPLRKPPAVQGPIRIVQVEGFDWSACGGTHVARTGAVGIIKVVRVERRGPETRLTFLCGGRALAHYAALNTLTGDLARRLTVAVEEIPATVERMQNEARSERRERERLQEALADFEAAALAAEHQRVGQAAVVTHVFVGRAPQEVRRVASRIVSRPGTVVLLGILPPVDNRGLAPPVDDRGLPPPCDDRGLPPPCDNRGLPPGAEQEGAKGGKAHLLFARSADLPHDMRSLLQQICRLVGGGGGGSPEMVQGGGCDPARLDEAIDYARSLLTVE